jgi:hypothetical protein
MTTTKPVSKTRLWISYILQTLVTLLLIMGAINNLLQTEMAVKGAIDMGYPENSVVYLGVILLLSTILFVIPKTAFIGAILISAWLGGAIATHIIHQDPLFNILFPAVFGKIMWISLWLRNEKIQDLVPFVKF